MAQKKAKKTCWFLNDPFRSGVVYEQLTKAHYNYVVGMDIGHGESLVYLHTRKVTVDDKGNVEEVSTTDKIRMNDNADTKIATMIGFNGDKTVIGRGAKNCPVYYQHFKSKPANWNALNRIGHCLTNRELMERYIQALWEGVLQYNPDLECAVKENRVLIAVGCPSSPDWMNEEAMKAYLALIREATGYDQVTVLAESTAAIMSAVLDANEIKVEKVDKTPDKNRDIPLNAGMAVTDAGSSTVDFTFSYMGKKLVTSSLNVAGYHLDMQMLEEILEQNQTSWEQIPDEQIPDLMLQLREWKEEFYPARLSLGIRVINIWGKDENGQVNKDISGGRLMFVFNQEFMERVLNRPGIQLSALEPKRSWLEHCETFIRDCSTLIDKDTNGKPMCQKVVLTGGTSYVQEFAEIVKRTFPDCVVVDSRDRSASVAKGLSYAKSLEIKGGKYVELFQKEIDQLAESRHTSFLYGLSKHLADTVCTDIQQVISECDVSNGKLTAGSLVDKINQRTQVNENLVGEAGQQKVEELFVEYFRMAHEETQEKVKAVSENIYGANLTSIPQIPKLTEEEMKQLTDNLDISQLLNHTWLSTVVTSINFSAINTLLFFIGCCLLEPPLTPIGIALMGLSALGNLDAVQQQVSRFIVRNKTAVPKWLIKKIGKNLDKQDKRKEMVLRASSKTVATMKKTALLKEEFVTGVKEQAEIMLGKVLFLVYDEKPDMQ